MYVDRGVSATCNPHRTRSRWTKIMLVEKSQEHQTVRTARNQWRSHIGGVTGILKHLRYTFLLDTCIYVRLWPFGGERLSACHIAVVRRNHLWAAHRLQRRHSVYLLSSVHRTVKKFASPDASRCSVNKSTNNLIDRNRCQNVSIVTVCQRSGLDLPKY